MYACMYAYVIWTVCICDIQYVCTYVCMYAYVIYMKVHICDMHVCPGERGGGFICMCARESGEEDSYQNIHTSMYVCMYVCMYACIM